MKASTAIIGDVHGNATALAGMLELVRGRFETVIFAGDYVDRGPDSASVLQLLVEYAQSDDRAVFLVGNHDAGFLDCLDSGALSRFLRMGGAATIKSYVPEPRGDVLAELRRVVPPEHLRFLRTLRDSYAVGQELLVTHDPRDGLRRPDSAFRVAGHVPQPSLRPAITANWAAIDTGCGTLPDGRLTCLIWPSLETLQVDAQGRPVGAELSSETHDG